MFKLLILSFLFCILSACSAHNPFILNNTTNLALVNSDSLSAHTGEVYILKGALPSDIEYKFISKVDIGKIWYGSSNDILASMADRAREVGGNAVINVRTWHQPSGFSWAAPHGYGEIVKIEDVKKIETSQIGGMWR